MALNSNDFDEFCQDLLTVRDVFRWVVTQFEKNQLFFGHGTDNAWDEAGVLLTAYLAIAHQSFNQILDSRLTLSEKKALYEWIEKRINSRIPLPYLTKQAWFADMRFTIDNRVLIPRSPIAELIQNDFQPWLELKDDLTILEIGTGSGCIACAVAHQFLTQGINIHVDASDVSDDALDVAATNIQNYNYNNVITLIKSDLFENIPQKKYDLIISNPPYVDEAEMQALPKEYLHEPQLALAAGFDGLELVDKMLKTASHYLSDKGILIVEVGASKPALEEKYPELAFTWLDFANGGDGVFLLTKSDLNELK